MLHQQQVILLSRSQVKFRCNLLKLGGQIGRGVPDPPESSGSERKDSADETEAEVDETEQEVEEAEPEPEVDEISDQDIVKLNFVALLGQQYQQPHFATYLEFIRTYDTDTHTGTVGGTAVTLSRQLVRDAFGLRVECIPAHLIFYVMTKIDGAAEEDYDLTAFTLEMLRHEIFQVSLHLDRTRHQRFLITFLGIPLTTILAHARVIDPAETITQPQPVPTRGVF
ncbi:hypothetical protein R1sor_007371 [Riccia sorocarpa]|uniref:Uncharacterized protein n=1 Tax=Riccia sorocarpa TaxID=122646 RepID=A0ABD3HQA0_9MARC